MVSSVDPDETAHSAVWSGSALFAQTCLYQYLELSRLDVGKLVYIY